MQATARVFRQMAAAGAALLLAAACNSGVRMEDRFPDVTYRAQFIEAGPMLHMAEVLSSDALEGRAVGTPGNEAARGFILKRFEELGLEPFTEAGFEYAFPVLPRPERTCNAPPEERRGVNLLARIPGRTPGEGPVMVLTAHYDHLGACDGEIFNGADDNASGTAALLALADYFRRRPPRHDIVIAALDAEEHGLLGARTLVRMPELEMERVALNINLDMVSRSEAGELYAAGTYHTPALVALVDEVAARAPVTLLMGHDRPEDGPNDWTLQSDHGPFHLFGVPFLYFGVEDHPGYHNPTDTFDAITPDFYVRAADTIAMAARAADAMLAELHALKRDPSTPADAEGPAE
ncbi:M28 family peptidase [Hyphomonas sp.]|uniref:M28 family peptidase n=1 Tax=Hyphomonas sp. TaxID=87 RepID=UPI00391B2A78